MSGNSGSKDDSLDFTRPDASAKPPSPQRVEAASKEAAAGTPHLEKSGFFVSIARRGHSRATPKNGSKYVVLVVEDDTHLSKLLVDILALTGYEVRCAANRAQINTELKRGSEIDVILLDVVLPDADGLQILRRLRDHPKYMAMPVIMMTGKSSAQDVRDGLAAGADGYVTKPFMMSGLVKALASVLGNA